MSLESATVRRECLVTTPKRWCRKRTPVTYEQPTKLRANLGPREVIEILGDSSFLRKLPALDQLKGARRIRTPLSEAQDSAIAAGFGFLEGQAREILMRP